MFDRGAAIPKWQTVFGRGYLGILRISHERDESNLSCAVATFDPLSFVERKETWPRPIWHAVAIEEWDDCRFIEGVEPIKTVTVTRWLRQVWQLTQLTGSEVTDVEAKLLASRPALLG